MRTRRQAMTVTETLIVGGLMGLGLLAVAVGIDSVRDALKGQQTRALLSQLDKALAVYHEATGRWPVGKPAPPATQSAGEAPESADGLGPLLSVLAGTPGSRAVLETLPPRFRDDASVKGAPAARTDGPALRDSWGRPLRCLTAGDPSAEAREAVAANQGRPIIISAGPDGRFGRRDIVEATDNIRSDGR